ncbi:MAG: transglutaminase domain-containing protein [Clostridia bacterium]|nr:transglutaminase domain-containing protein [Clostridia bacterium]
MKKLFKSFMVMCVVGSMLLSSVQGVFAKPLEGEVMKTVTYKQIYDGQEQTNIADIVVPEKFAHLDLVPNEIEVIQDNEYGRKYGMTWWVCEPEIIDGVTYKWIHTQYGSVDVLDEYVLMKESDMVNPFYEPDDTKRIDYSERYNVNEMGKVSSGLNPYSYYGKDASQIKVFIDGTTRSFKTAFYPKRNLKNHAINVQGHDSRIPMVGIREFVDSVPYMSLVWDNGKIIVSNSKTGLDTVFNIYSNSTDLKAIMLDGSTYASLDDLLIAQFSLTEFKMYKCITWDDTKNLGYFKQVGTLEDGLGAMYEAYSNVGAMSPFLLERFLPQNAGICTSSVGSMLATKSWVPYNKEGSLTVLNILENKVNPAGCIYDGDAIVSFTMSANKENLNYWKEEMLKVTSKYSTDKEKAENLAKYLRGVFFHLDLVSPSYNADDAVKDKMFVGVCSDIADLYCIGLGQAGVPSVVVNGKLKANNPRGLSQGHAINGVYYDGAWHYYDISSYSDKNKDALSDFFFADAIWGIREVDDISSDVVFDDINELSMRYKTLGYTAYN